MPFLLELVMTFVSPWSFFPGLGPLKQVAKAHTFNCQVFVLEFLGLGPLQQVSQWVSNPWIS